MSTGPEHHRGRPAQISRGNLLDAALGIVTDSGVDALTMRTLAKQLGVSTMAIYRHVSDKDELLAAVLDRQVALQGIPRLPEDPRRRIHKVFEWIRAGLTARPWVVELITRGEFNAQSAAWSAESILEALVELGLSPSRAIDAYLVMWRYTMGAVVVQQFEPRKPPDAGTRADRPTVAQAPAGDRTVLEIWRSSRHAVDFDFAAGLSAILDSYLGSASSPSSPSPRQVRPAPQPGSAADVRVHGRLGYWALNVHDVDRAARFFAKVFGWRFNNPDAVGGRAIVGQWGGLQLSNQFRAPIVYTVDDLSTAAERIVAMGGDATRPGTDRFGRYFEAVDPVGVHFGVWEPARGREPPVDMATSQNALGSYSLFTRDISTTQRFFAELFGWKYRALAGGDSRLSIRGSHPVGFISPDGKGARGGLTLQVDDVGEIILQIRALGGWAEDLIDSPYGPFTYAADDQGTLFSIWQRAG